MVFLLVFNVVNDDIFFSYRISKCSIPILPSSKLRKPSTFFHPNAAGYFNVFNITGK